MRRVTAVVVGVLIPVALLSAPSFSADAGKGEEVTILRDDFGTPNIFAETAEGAVFGLGYAQAEDRLEEIFRQYRRCEGTMSEVFGAKQGDEDNFQDDYRQRLWRHREVAETNYP